ncbi:MAG: Kae1-associated serine/threonine protein kinase [Candidatus Levybacteria bacterium]|nr:Kae1-associated serine/threonine protein kinase [Candidatus Levybacteria bacterium]
MKIIQRGAEAILYLEHNKIIKERIKKSYRIPEIDIEKRKYPTRREAKLLQEASKVIYVPRVFEMDDKNMKVIMEYIDGKRLKDIFDNLKNRREICLKIGNSIARLHDNDIIHSDLTTSNMILKDDRVYFIDFGLGFISKKIEDKAVDLHLMKQALNSKHYNNSEESFKLILEGYKASKNYNEVIKKLEKVESRGRYKARV